MLVPMEVCGLEKGILTTMPRSWKALTSTQRVQSSWCVLWPQNPFIWFTSLMRYMIGVRWFHSHNVSLRVKEPLCSIEPLSGISQANGYGASRSFSPGIAQSNPNWLAKWFLLQIFDEQYFFRLGQDLICAAREHFQLSTTKGDISYIPWE